MLDEVASSDVNGLLLKIMAEKINTKFGSVLNENQKKIVQLYGIGDKVALIAELSSLKTRILSQLSLALESKEYDKEVKTKLEQARDLITDKYADTTKCDDQEMISCYLGMSKLEKELSV